MGEFTIRRPAAKAAILFGTGIFLADIVMIPQEGVLATTAVVLLLLSAGLFFKCTSISDPSLLLFVVSLGALSHSFTWNEVETRRLNPTEPGEIVELRGRIESDILHVEKRLRFVVADASLIRNGREVAGEWRLNVSVSKDTTSLVYAGLEHGIIIEGRGELLPFPRARNPGEYNYGRYLLLHDIHGLIAVPRIDSLRIVAGDGSSFNAILHRARAAVSKVITGSHSPEAAAFLKGILIADRSGIPLDVRQSFVNTGTVHILAVSGLQIVIVAVIFYSLFGLLRVPRRVVPIATIFGLAFYTVLIGSPASCVRATIMASTVLAGRLLERRTDVYNSLGAAALVILLWDTRQLFDVGFQLSFAAVFSIVYFYPFVTRIILKIPEGWEEIKAIDNVLKLFAVSCAAQLGTLPLVAYYFERVSLVSFLVNVAVVPLSNLNVMIGFATILFAPVSTFVADCYALVNDLLVQFVLGLIKAASEVTMAYVETAGLGTPLLILYYLVLLGTVHLGNPPVRKTTIFALLIFANGYIWHDVALLEKPLLRVTVLDVGQGDAIVIEFPNGKAALIDAGPRIGEYDAGKRNVAPFLNRAGISQLDALVVSHAHSDHIGGIPYLLDQFEVQSFVEARPAKTSLYRAIKKIVFEKGIRVDSLAAGTQLNLDHSTRLYVLHPHPGFISSNLNNTSVTLKLVYGKTSMLFVGDLEADGEEAVLARYRNFLDVDLLKVGHHGSSTSSTSEFISAATPTEAVISVGWKNNFRHPSKEVIDRLTQRGARVVRTDRNGGIIYVSDGHIIRQISPENPN